MKRQAYILYIVLATLFLAGCSSNELVTQESKDITNQDDDDTTLPINDSYTYKLPVIFHVLYTEDNDSVRALATQLPRVLGFVNELYQGNVYSWRGVYSQNINVDFQPALSDEEGNRLSTPGVVFQKWNGKFPIEASSFMSSKNTQYIWEPNEYINVIVYPFEQNTKGSVILGISHMPYTLDDSTHIDGLESASAHYISKNNLGFPYCVSINSDYVNRMSTRYTAVDSLGNRTYGRKEYIYDSCDIVATLAHELGHYLGLHHVFAEEKKKSSTGSGWTAVDDCFDSDCCDDTPSYNKVEYDDSLRNAPKGTKMQTLIARHSCDGEEFESDNIMDYSIGLVFQFSPEQKERMRHVLYYSPLIPGPKLNHTNTGVETRAAADNGIINLPIVTSE